MATVGRKRKAGERYPNGQLKRVRTKEAKQEAERRKLEGERAVVLAQPHRRGSMDCRAESEFGRFCMARGLRLEISDAGDAYFRTVRKWSGAIHAPGLQDRQERGGSGSGDGPSRAQIEGWRWRISDMDAAMSRASPEGAKFARRLILFRTPVPPRLDREVIAALAALAESLGLLPRGVGCSPAPMPGEGPKDTPGKLLRGTPNAAVTEKM